MSCSHLHELTRLQPPRLSQSVHREECTQCFDNQDQPLGIDVCLQCFTGGCLDRERHHMRTHVSKTGHAFTLNIKRRLKPSANRPEDEEPPAKMTKLAIIEDREEDKYEHKTVLKCWKCNPESGHEIPEASADPNVKSLVDGVMHSLSSARQSEVKAWEEEIMPCEHTLTLEQFASGPIEQSGLAHCNKCELKENLWLCLTCGALGCGRPLYGGAGGNGHALAHFQDTTHPVCVKLGTITPEGNADIYCYACDDAKLDPELAAHLATFGINVQTQTKTEKSMTELQIEHNLKFDFSLTGEDGKALEPVFGPGLTGLANLGNSCYMASVLQTVFSLPAFQNRYVSAAAQEHWATCPETLPADCLDCQLYKIADGLLSGRYSHPRPIDSASQASSPPPQAQPDPKSTNPLAHDSPTPVFQEGIRPSMFKALIGKGHEEFSTMRQQDSEEFFTHFLSTLRKQLKRTGNRNPDPTEVFKFGMEQRLQCGDCKKVRYRVDEMDVASVPVPKREKGTDEEGKTLFEDVSLKECLDILTGAEALEYTCPACQKQVIATKQSKFATFPDVLVIHAKKFQLVNWVPSKLDIPVILPEDDILQLDGYLGHGLQPNEQELPEEKSASALPEFNQEALAQLEAMGFPVVRCQKALLATGNSDPNAAMEWLFQHMEDPDIDAPIQVAGGSSSSSGPEPSPEQISMLSDMGFTPAQARKALRETGGDAERAVDWLFSHPDDTGEDSSPATSSSGPAQSSGPGGSARLPARFRLKAFISHKGPSVHSGHYVAHIRVHDANVGGESWVLFNDEKVVKADAESVRELKKLAYLYVFERI
ncbi:ubiquitinyl hydrolase [Panus rudis PR-1116 ss-1]|nr:ubiquitinyl hydrolase [Panus rudis PR-1116 ss-1]